jgi:putative tricarboxylic transport membrane protein
VPRTPAGCVARLANIRDIGCTGRLACGRSGHNAAREIKPDRLLDSIVVNKVGGGGSLAYGYVGQKTGDGHHLAIAQAGLITNALLGRSPITYADVTPLAYIGTEAVALAVRADSRFKTLQDFVEQLRRDPQSIAISVGSTRGATNHFTIAKLAKVAGVDPKRLKILVFGGGAESVTNLLGGHIDAMVQAANNAIPHVQAGTMRILAISLPRRSAGLPNVPTFREQGFDVVMDGWYVFVGPRGMSAPQIAFWDNAFARVAESPEWKKFGEQSGWEPGFKPSRETAAFLRAEHDEAKSLLSDLGLLGGAVAK